MPTIYPDWEIYIYHDTTVPSNIIDKLTKYKYVKMINMFNSSIVNKVSWCFLVASEKNVERYVIGNIDTRLSLRDKSAVDDWITSGKIIPRLLGKDGIYRDFRTKANRVDIQMILLSSKQQYLETSYSLYVCFVDVALITKNACLGLHHVYHYL
jgi:hypothetical protein